MVASQFRNIIIRLLGNDTFLEYVQIRDSLVHEFDTVCDGIEDGLGVLNCKNKRSGNIRIKLRFGCGDNEKRTQIGSKAILERTLKIANKIKICCFDNFIVEYIV